MQTHDNCYEETIFSWFGNIDVETDVLCYKQANKPNGNSQEMKPERGISLARCILLIVYCQCTKFHQGFSCNNLTILDLRKIQKREMIRQTSRIKDLSCVVISVSPEYLIRLDNNSKIKQGRVKCLQADDESDAAKVSHSSAFNLFSMIYQRRHL